MFLNIMLEELNSKFALQLDLGPITDWSCQSATDAQAKNSQYIVLAGGSHSSRLIGPLESAHLTVVDSTVAGFRITVPAIKTASPAIISQLFHCLPRVDLV
jgi:hypothetical protein